jgi:hypothetical protein
MEATGYHSGRKEGKQRDILNRQSAHSLTGPRKATEIVCVKRTKDETRFLPPNIQPFFLKRDAQHSDYHIHQNAANTDARRFLSFIQDIVVVYCGCRQTKWRPQH